MPIKITNELPAKKILENENVFIMTEERATMQDIRPLKIILLNLMPTKIETETQFIRLLSNSPLQVEVDLLQTASHEAKNTPTRHLLDFYKTFEDVRDNRYDGMIITGAPVEKLPFEEVDYWEELCDIMEWSKRNVYSTMHICWGAQAGMYIISALTRPRCHRSFQAFTATGSQHHFIRWCEASMISIGDLTPVTPRFPAMT